MILNNKYFLFYFLLFFSHILISQERQDVAKDSTNTENLDEVIVTATRTIRQLSSVPLPAQIVSKKEIRDINSVRLTDLLSEQTGLMVVQDHGEGIQMQGFDSDYTLIMIDGVPLIGRTAGTFDLNRISVGNIKQLEIVKGASSSLYGSEALAGVINIITEDPKEGFKGDLDFRGGTFSSFNTGANINYKKEKLGLTFFINRYGNDGYDLDKSDALKTVDPYTNYTFNTKVGYDISENTSLLVSGRYFTEHQDYIPTEDLAGEANVNEWNTHVKLDHSHNKKWNSYVEFYASQYNADNYLNNTDDGSRFSESDYKQLMVRPELRMVFNPTKKHAFIGGVGLTHESLDRTYFSNKPTFNSPYIYAQYDANPTEKWNVIIGARFDNHNQYKSQFSPKFAVRYKFNDKISIKSSVGYGFKAPAFRQLYLDFTNPTAGYTVIGYNRVPDVLPQLQDEGQIINMLIPISSFNGNLKPESSVNINAGVQLKPSSGITIDINAFRNDVKDLIDTRVIARKTNGQNVFSYQNISRVYTQGIEFNTSWKPTNQLRISGGYQLLYAIDKDAEKAFENGEVFARDHETLETFKLKKDDYFGLFNRSRHMANAKVFYSIPKWNLNTNIRATYRSKYGLRDSNNNNYIDKYDNFVDGYAIVDFAINKTLYKNYQVGFGIDNLLDFTDTQNIGNIPGRLIYGTFNIQL